MLALRRNCTDNSFRFFPRAEDCLPVATMNETIPWSKNLKVRLGALAGAFLLIWAGLFGAHQYVISVQRESLQCASQGADEKTALDLQRAELETSRVQPVRWILAGLVLAIAAVAVLVGADVVQRLRSLNRTAQRILAGDLRAKANLSGKDEIAALGSAFDAMTASLHASLDKATDEKTRNQAIIDCTADGVFSLNEKGVILSLNAAVERIFGYPAESLVNRNVSAIVPVLYQEGKQEYEDRDIAAGEAKVIGEESVVKGIRRDGSKFPLTLRVAEMRYHGERLFIATVQDITARLKAEEERARLFDAIREAVGQLAAASAQILASTSEQASGAQEQAAAVSQTVTTVDEVTQTATQAAQRAKGVGDVVQRNLEVGKAGRKAVEESIGAMNNLKDQVESTAENILSLAEQAQLIGDIIATVNDIAEQTNLLALNAAIEASRAGEHGRGFAVVAGEVRTLADQSKKATAQVRQILSQIQKATNTAVLSTEEVTKGMNAAIKVGGQTGETINTLVEALANTAQAAAQIVASANQQAMGMTQIHQAMRNLDQVAKQNLVATRQVEQAAQNLNSLGTQLTGLTAAK